MSAIHGQVLVDTLRGNAAFESPRLRRIMTWIISRLSSLARATKTMADCRSKHRIGPKKNRRSGRGSICDTNWLCMEIDSIGYSGPSVGISQWPSKPFFF